MLVLVPLDEVAPIDQFTWIFAGFIVLEIKIVYQSPRGA